MYYQYYTAGMGGQKGAPASASSVTHSFKFIPAWSVRLRNVESFGVRRSNEEDIENR